MRGYYRKIVAFMQLAMYPQRMANNESKLPGVNQVAALYRIPVQTLSSMRQRGCDVMDAREFFRALMKTTRKPDEWREFFAEADDDSHEHWKKQKTKEEVERLRLMNSKAGGEMFDRADGERIQEAWGSALNLALAERQATAPQLLAGKDEAWIADWFEEENRKVRENLSDLESSLWESVYEQYAKTEESSTNDEAGGKRPTQTKKDGKRMVRGKRQSGSGSNAKA